MIGQKLILLDEVDSTNNYAAKLLNEGNLAHGTVILAEKQTAGKGQRGNSWSSGAENQLSCSVYAETAFLSADRYWYLNLAVAIAVYHTINSSVPREDVRIKWPNDVLVNDKKLSGILIETHWRSGAIQGAIIGVGINVNRERNLPGSAALNDFTVENRRPVQLAQTLCQYLSGEFARLTEGKWNDLLSDYHRFLWKKDELTEAETTAGEKMIGTIRGIDGNGDLLFEGNGTLRAFGLKEISFSY
jgi:BirA family transcriptional regulator, biotin operon repressor / biotin---[acetyl-CoA-carboxylase] ligase